MPVKVLIVDDENLIVMSTQMVLESIGYEVVAALDGHLCRCGAHTRIIRAITRAAAVLRGEG